MDMICTCNIDGIREVEAMRHDAMLQIGLTDMSELATAIILSIAFDFGADVDIAADMWFGTQVIGPGIDEWVECDWPFDGLLAIWLKLAKELPDRITKGTGTDAHYHQAELTSFELVANIEKAETAEDAHRREEHAGEFLDSCKECSVLMGKYVSAKQALDNAWGAKAFDSAIKRAYE